MPTTVVSRADWLTARKALLAEERALTHQRDRVNAQRRALPWVKVEEPYLFDSIDGPKTLADLFDGRRQLFVQHFMLTPDSDHICSGCSIMGDQVDGARRHFEHADLSFAAVSRAPVARIEAVKARLGWDFRWVSSGANSFNYDYGVSFTPEQVASGDVGYNFGTTRYAAEELHGTSVFAKDDDDAVYHTYSTYARGAEAFVLPFAFLDCTPKGRSEQGTMSWVRLNDEYEDPPAAARCEAHG